MANCRSVKLPLPIDDQRTATLHDYHVFVVIVEMFRGGQSHF